MTTIAPTIERGADDDEDDSEESEQRRALEHETELRKEISENYDL